MRRGIAAVLGSRVESFERHRCALKPIQIRPRVDVARRRVCGKRILEIGRLGKRVVLGLEGQLKLIIEPRMTGLVLISDPPDVDHLRVRIGLAGGPLSELWYWDRRGLGSLQLCSEEELQARLSEGRIGPDALEVDAATLKSRLKDSRREIKVALLDQRALAGVGNLYAAEILHVAKVHPQKSCRRLSKAEWIRLHEALQNVLREAIHYEGSTLSDGTYRNALSQAGSYQNHHRVYDRAGALCMSCRCTKIQRIVQAQRSTFFCPQCQRKR